MILVLSFNIIYDNIKFETRVNEPKTMLIRKKFDHVWNFEDNYREAVNGRLWVLWDRSQVVFENISCTDQTLHGRVRDLAGTNQFQVTFV